MHASRQARPLLWTHAHVSSAWVTTRSGWSDAQARRRADDRGEGVISAALVVLIMAIIAALMWTAFKGIWDTVETNTRTEVEEIGT
jgi:hypothetical protein